MPCTDEEWAWDKVRFFRRGTSDGCWIGARAGGRLLLVAPVRIPSGEVPQIGEAAVQVLPRRARDAAILMGKATPGVLALASLSPGEWQSAGWREVRQMRGASGQSLWGTPNHGALRLILHADGRLARPAMSARRAGIWSSTGGTGACPAP
jgi:hypothetical protein